MFILDIYIGYRYNIIILKCYNIIILVGEWTNIINWDYGAISILLYLKLILSSMNIVYNTLYITILVPIVYS